MERSSMINKIQNILSKYKDIRYAFREIQQNIELLEYINNLTSWNNTNKLSEKIYCIQNNITKIPRCSCGNSLKFIVWCKGYRDYCSRKCRANSIVVKNKKDKTCISKYGVSNISQLDSIKQKKKQTLFKNFGVEYSWQLPQFREGMQLKYGVDHNSKMSEVLDRRKVTWKTKYGVPNPLLQYGVSKISQELCWSIHNKLTKELQDKCYFMEKSNFEFNKQYGKEYYQYDFVISSIKYCIEFNGDFWHLNPEIYNENTHHPILNKSAKEIWQFDENKIKLLESDGFKVKVVWEKDYLNNKEQVIQTILNDINTR
jgi:G:T-mismatch repair DNA endonuclease (very short patch repair protein)